MFLCVSVLPDLLPPEGVLCYREGQAEGAEAFFCSDGGYIQGKRNRKVTTRHELPVLREYRFELACTGICPNV